MTDPADMVTLRYTPFDSVGGGELLERYRALLDPAERQRERSFYFERDRNRHVIAHALLRTALTEESGGAVAPEHWRFRADRSGRPSLLGDDMPPLSFNLTHADGLAAVAVTRRRAVGVDAERIGGNRAAAGPSAGLFAPHEAESIEACPPEQRIARFLEYWTLKEARVKADGSGVALPFDRPAFRFPADGLIELCAGSDPGEPGRGWKFWQLRLRDDFLLALCVERTGAAPLALQVIEMVPLVSETSVACVLQRESA